MSSENVLSRVQYTFRAKQFKVLRVLNAAAVAAVNVVGLAWISCQVTVVVGDPAFNTPAQNEQFEQILAQNCVRYKKATALQIVDPTPQTGTPGVYVRYANALEAAHIRIHKSYFGEPAPGKVLSIFFQVSERNTNQAKEILNSLT